ncbi:hypothetical protein [Aquimarina brevivitae]|uniref:Outer membrane protein beta-barrel domain-containing protein n=1 Tax=Aquimarina brevivitae TaxID=323412 RepID=A0A4Q7PJ88_9FLAO|nr:hypothetical protein [Aquimarina brevivitae]RZS98982.1 hypothetical protein EV197_0184 [Aquimarina brevivitae]
MKVKLLLTFFLLTSIAFGQNLDQIGKTPLVKVNGGISANTIYYNGSANRDPFTYFVNGNLNFNISGIYNIPLSFSYTNQDFSYNTPFKINRLSIHPSYKWVATHIGDVAMTFSPYTVNGHQFTGFGTDLTPNGPWKLSAFYGRLLRATEYNAEVPEAIPAYRRMGYGLKAGYEFNQWNLGLTVFKAKDEINSLNNPIPSEINIDPKENLVVSLESSVNVFKNLTFNLEVARSAVTENIEDEREAQDAVFGLLIDEKASTDYYTAMNANFTYTYGRGSVGVGYERIDPEYRTFGAYFFNNDLENITVNAAQELFNGRVNLAINAGLQRDDLRDEKESQSTRIVSAANATIKASDRLNIAASYSNFQSYTNIRTAFDVINQVDPLENLDTLDFRQVSQNASLNLGYLLSQSKTKQQNIGFNLTYQTTKDEQGTAEATNNTTNFYNTAANYALTFPERSLSLNAAVNAAFNKVEENDALTYGPTVGVNKQFFDKKLRTGISASYNESLVNGTSQGNVMNFRASSGYIYKEKHNFNLNALALFRNSTTTKANDFTLTFGYTYSFDVKKPDLRFLKRRTDENDEIGQANAPKDSLQKLEIELGKTKQNYYRFRYRGTVYEGNTSLVINQIEAQSYDDYLKNKEAFGQQRLEEQLATLKTKAAQDDDFRNEAIDYLDAVYARKDFVRVYKESLTSTLQKLRQELQGKEQQMKEKYALAKADKESHPLHKLSVEERKNADEQQQFDYMKLTTIEKVDAERLESYLFTRFEIEKIFAGNGLTDRLKNLEQFTDQYQELAFDRYQKDKNLEKINIYLEEQIISYYDNLYKETID